MKRVSLAVLGVALLLSLSGCWFLDEGVTVKDGFSRGGQYLSVEGVAPTVGTASLRVSGIKDMPPVDEIHWGDSFGEQAYTKVERGQSYSHHFEREGVFGVRLLDANGNVVDDSIIVVEHVGGDVALVSRAGATITVQWWGLPKVDYFIVWGDSSMTYVNSRDNLWGPYRSHTYAIGGTVEIGIQGLADGGDAYRACFTVDLDG